MRFADKFALLPLDKWEKFKDILEGSGLSRVDKGLVNLLIDQSLSKEEKARWLKAIANWLTDPSKTGTRGENEEEERGERNPERDESTQPEETVKLDKPEKQKRTRGENPERDASTQLEETVELDKPKKRKSAPEVKTEVKGPPGDRKIVRRSQRKKSRIAWKSI